MRTILCYGDSNTWGCIPEAGEGEARRFPLEQRWPSVLARELGAGHQVVAEGLNGRTTVWDDPLEPGRNGRTYLLPCLLSHSPVSLVVMMLGTNDLKFRIGARAGDIAQGAGLLLDDVLAAGVPHALLVCPPPLAGEDEEFAGGLEKSRGLARHYAAVAAARGCAFIDAGEHIRSSELDGIHFDADQHERLGRVVAETVRASL